MSYLSGAEAAYAQEIAAKRAAMVEFRDNTFVSKDEPRRVVMEVVSRTVEIQGNRIGDVLTSVSLFLDRFFGPQPEPGTVAGAPTPQPTGVIHEVERNLSRNDRLLCDLEEKIRRLGDIA